MKKTLSYEYSPLYFPHQMVGLCFRFKYSKIFVVVIKNQEFVIFNFIPSVLTFINRLQWYTM